MQNISANIITKMILFTINCSSVCCRITSSTALAQNSLLDGMSVFCMIMDDGSIFLLMINGLEYPILLLVFPRLEEYTRIALKINICFSEDK